MIPAEADPFLPPDKEDPVQFFSELDTFEFPPQATITAWIRRVLKGRGGQLVKVQYIFCDDRYLHQINLKYLSHDTFTDIITFPYQEPPRVEGDIFISVERVRENARELGLPYFEELLRVMIHGVLHLSGQGDKTPEEKARMTREEDQALQIWAQMQGDQRID